MSIELLRDSTRALSEKIAKKPRLFEKQSFSLVQHVTDMMELLNEIDRLEFEASRRTYLSSR